MSSFVNMTNGNSSKNILPYKRVEKAHILRFSGDTSSVEHVVRIAIVVAIDILDGIEQSIKIADLEAPVSVKKYFYGIP